MPPRLTGIRRVPVDPPYLEPYAELMDFCFVCFGIDQDKHPELPSRRAMRTS